MRSNADIVPLSDGRIICTSYGLPVAVKLPADYDKGPVTFDQSVVVKSDKVYSVTSSRHANTFARRMTGANPKVVPHEVFVRLVSPLLV